MVKLFLLALMQYGGQDGMGVFFHIIKIDEFSILDIPERLLFYRSYPHIILKERDPVLKLEHRINEQILQSIHSKYCAKPRLSDKTFSIS